MLCLIADDGAWIVPDIGAVSVMGDVNADGDFNVADLVMMQKYILGSGELVDWEAGDLTSDGTIGSFDLVLMRKQIVS